MKILIIEDEARIAKRIRRMAEGFFGTNTSEIHTCESLADGLRELERNQFDLLLLDLNLNGEDGFAVLENMVARSFHTIIISANTHRAIQAFAYGVLDFVPKPFDQSRLEQAFLRISSLTSTTVGLDFLAVKKANQISLIDIKELCYVRGAGIYTELHLLNGRTELHDKSLDKLQQLLSNDFERIHKSYIVAKKSMHQITAEAGSKYALLLKNGEILPIGRSRYKELKEKFL